LRSRGCNRLIQQGVARLLSSGEQLAAELSWLWPAGGAGVQAAMAFESPALSLGSSQSTSGSSQSTSGSSHSTSGSSRSISGFSWANTPEDRLLRLIREKESPGIDALVECSGLDASVVALALLQLELEGAITVLPGKRYQPTSVAGGG
jgi:predicted Rossmann fold nucleotide-binding protein DprA/Smf involved in DNA uptake